MTGLRTQMIAPAQALPGRETPVATDTVHAVLGTALKGPYPAGMESVVFAMGSFWGAERLFWRQPGVHVTATGYIGGYTPHPTYTEVCSGLTGHAEGVLVVYDPGVAPFEALLNLFWDYHDPTQGDLQGKDPALRYRSAVFTRTPNQFGMAARSRDLYQGLLSQLGKDAITTQIHGPDAPCAEFYFAEGRHQAYLHKNPNGYCGLKRQSLSCVA